MDEIPTLTAFSYLGFGTLVLALLIAWRFLPGSSDRGAIRMYLISGALTAAGAVADVLRYLATPAWAVAVSFVLTMLAELTGLVAARRLLHRGPTPLVFFLVTALGALVTMWFTLVEPDYVVRSAAVLIVSVILSGAMAWTFLRAREAGLTVLFVIIGSIYLAYSLLCLARLMAAPGMRPDSDLDQAPTSVLLNQLLALPLLMMIGLMVVTVTARRAHAAIEDDRDVAVETSVDLLADTWSDPLTGLASRARIRSVLEDSLASRQSPGAEAVLVAALDGNVAETYGHQVADEALIDLAGRVRALFGIAPQDWDSAGRWGENSIIVISPPAGRSTRQWALSLLDSVRSITTAAGQPCSASVAEVHINPGTTIASLEAAIRTATASALDAGPAGLASNVPA